jgi:hypothetical protein
MAVVPRIPPIFRSRFGGRGAQPVWLSQRLRQFRQKLLILPLSGSSVFLSFYFSGERQLDAVLIRIRAVLDRELF